MYKGNTTVCTVLIPRLFARCSHVCQAIVIVFPYFGKIMRFQTLVGCKQRGCQWCRVSFSPFLDVIRNTLLVEFFHIHSVGRAFFTATFSTTCNNYAHFIAMHIMMLTQLNHCSPTISLTNILSIRLGVWLLLNTCNLHFQRMHGWMIPKKTNV